MFIQTGGPLLQDRQGKEIEMRRTIICAEIGANHLQDYDRAVQLVNDAKWAGADMVKVQMYTPDSLTIDSQDERFQIKEGPWAGQTLYELYTKTCMPYEWVPKLKKLAEDLGLLFMTSVYDVDTVDIAEKMGIEWYKIASFEINHLELIEKVGSVAKYAVLSLGCNETARTDEVANALRILLRCGVWDNRKWILHCVPEYPTPDNHANLTAVLTYRDRYYYDGCPSANVGYSDHTESLVAPAIAVGMGAELIEKHIGIGNGKDIDFFAISREKFSIMVGLIRHTEQLCVGRRMGSETKYKRKLIDGKLVRTVC